VWTSYFNVATRVDKVFEARNTCGQANVKQQNLWTRYFSLAPRVNYFNVAPRADKLL